MIVFVFAGAMLLVGDLVGEPAQVSSSPPPAVVRASLVVAAETAAGESFAE